MKGNRSVHRGKCKSEKISHTGCRNIFAYCGREEENMGGRGCGIHIVIQTPAGMILERCFLWFLNI
jgi:hypothetical protein